MAMSYKSFSLWLLSSLVVGAALGAYGTVKWKDREIDRRIAAAVRVEQDRHAQLYDERDALREKLEHQRLQLELAGIAVDVERRNFGLAQERLTKLGEALERMEAAADAPRAEAIGKVLARTREITADLEALDPQAAVKLQQLFGALQDALAD